MPGFSAGQFGVGERAFSDVEEVQAPVVDKSSLVEGEAYTQGVMALGEDIFNGVAAYQQSSRLAATAKAKEDEKSFGNQYDQSIRKFSTLVSSGQISQDQATVYLGREKDRLLNMGASADDLTSTELQTTKTLAGRALVEGSREEQAQKALDKKYDGSSYFVPNQSPEERQLGMVQMREDELDAEARSIEMSRLSLESARLDKGSKEYTGKQREIKEKQMEYVNKLLSQAPINASNEQKRLVADYEANLQKMSESEARVVLENKWKGYVRSSTRTADQFAARVEGGLPVQRTAYVDTLTAISDSFLESIGQGQVVAMEEKLLKEKQGRLKVAILNSSEDVQKLQVVTDILGPGAAAYFQGLTSKAATHLNDFNVDVMTREEGDPAPSFGKDKQTLEDARTTLTLTISDFLDGKHKGDPKNLEKLFSGHVARVSEDFKTMTSKEMDKSLAFLATPEVGRFVQMRGLSNTDLDNVKRQVFTYKGKVADNFLTLVKETVSADDKKASLLRTNPRLAMAAARVPEFEDFDVVFEGGQVMVRAKAERGRKQAEELNNKITGPLTRIVRVDSNLSGKSQESIFKSWKEQLWPDPSKQGEQAPDQAEPTTPAATSVADPTQYTGQVVKDEKGDTWASRGGSWVKIGGDGNGSK